MSFFSGLYVVSLVVLMRRVEKTQTMKRHVARSMTRRARERGQEEEHWGSFSTGSLGSGSGYSEGEQF